jgi:glycosyltransferase involved in cell wall biosynthesis
MESVEVSVAVLAYNEVDNLSLSVSEILSTLETMGRDFELIIVDDGSTDGTGRVADCIAEMHPRVRVVHHDTNLGLGGGYRTGFGAAHGTYLTFFPADGQFPAEIVAMFLPRMAANDLVLGYLPARYDSWLAKGLSAGERALYAVIFGRMPRFQGIFMVRREKLLALRLQSTGRGWAILMELILRAKRAQWRIESVPTSVRPRMAGQSKVNNVRTIVSNVVQMLALRRLLQDSRPSHSDRA